LNDTTDSRAARDSLIEAARQAGDIAMTFFRAGERTSARVDWKAGGSPVTEADLAADGFLHAWLMAAFPRAGWLSEETEDNSDRLKHAQILIVDPIDGTRAFLTGDPRWAVSLALIEDGRPIAAVVHAPALGKTYGAAAGAGATLNGAPIRASKRRELAGAHAAGPKLMVERIGRAVASEFELAPKIPSLAYRLVRVAEGALDFALASEDAHDWDVAAADLILEEAGGRLTRANGDALRYNLAHTRHAVLLGASHALSDPLLAAARDAGLK
jgi:myo-inositol-1(or 4)-monophosphatase